ncbi:MAG: adenosine deaminase [bacterium]|nr:adenosine deaminase [bacterium]
MNKAVIADLPKVELHNHLDGGLRVETVIELAAAIDYPGLPSTDRAELEDWFLQDDSGSLESYLAGFEHTIAVMQTKTAIERVAYESGLDAAADGVVYAEIRFAPSLNTQRGLAQEDAIEAALAGFAQAEAEAPVTLRLIVDAMRNEPDSMAAAKAATRFAGQGVVGFDLAGPEFGFPADDHAEACALALDNGLGLTIHAGEAEGPESIRTAIEKCGAQRIGHGIRIIEDLEFANGEVTRLGDIAMVVRDQQIPLEVCPTSNIHTLGINAASHPLGLLTRHGFNVTLSTDNRLMSAVTLSDELRLAVDYHGYDLTDLCRVTLAALDAAFIDEAERAPIRAIVAAGYAR